MEHPDDQSKTIITMPFGLFQFLFMPFCLACVAKVFQRFIHVTIHGFDFAFDYINDVLINSSPEQKHLEYFHMVLNVFLNMGLALILKKCVFGVQKLSFMG